jgi:hypothetical protein
MRTIELTAPSAWASYLINQDESGLDAEEIRAIHRWLHANDVGFPVYCDDAGFINRHDALAWSLPADCQTYTFLEAR